MTVITLDGIKNLKHRSVLRYISDVFDEHRGNIPDHIALTKFNSQNHTILFNTETPDLNGKTLIPFDSEKLLFAPIKINSIICSDPQNNNSINVLTQRSGGLWEAVSDENKIAIFVKFDKTPINGISIKFADAVRTKYRTSIQIGNDDDGMLSEMLDMDSSWDTNNHQFYQFSSAIEGATKAKITIELVGTNKDFVWKIGNISLYSNMNLESMKNLNESGIITWSLISNPTVRKGMDAEPDSQPQKMAIQDDDEQELGYTDYAGSPLIYAPDRSRQFFDKITPEEITRISNIPRLYSSTELPTGDYVYTFQTNEKDRAFTLKFSPQVEMNKYPGEAETDLDKLLQRGYIKQGGFKNYILTMYIKLDKIEQTNQFLLWKYGGFFFSKQQPQLARAVNVTIPVNNVTDDIPHIYTEYFFERLNDMTGVMIIIDGDFKGIEAGKWIGLQFIRQVDTEAKKATQLVRINKNPMDEQGRLVNPNDFTDYIIYNDEVIEQNGDGVLQEHTPHIWAGVNEVISVVGAEFVNIQGISLYEYIKN